MISKDNTQAVFRELGNKIDKAYFRIFYRFVFVVYLMVLCALIFRATSGFVN